MHPFIYITKLKARIWLLNNEILTVFLKLLFVLYMSKLCLCYYNITSSQRQLNNYVITLKMLMTFTSNVYIRKSLNRNCYIKVIYNKLYNIILDIILSRLITRHKKP